MRPKLLSLRRELEQKANTKKAKVLASFFKTKPGQYSFGEKFLGIGVPELRKISLQYLDLNNLELKKLLQSNVHEEKLIGVLILVKKYQTVSSLFEKKERQIAQKKIIDFYLNNLSLFNNWDLVDLSAPKILGLYLAEQTIITRKRVLDKLVCADNFWMRRIAIVSLLPLIKAGRFTEILRIVKILLTDTEDLIQKALGWMLREVGKKDKNILIKFLEQHAVQMPRVMLRYAIERLPKQQRKYFLQKKKDK